MKLDKNISNSINNNLDIAIDNLKKLNSKYYKDQINIAANLSIKALKNGKKIIFCGNGGSAADSQHLCAELVSKFLKNRKPIPSISLTTNTSTITSVSNDFDYKFIFSKQIEALGKSGDILIAISTSGQSKNIIEALKVSKQKGLTNILLTGNKIKNKKYCNIVIDVPAERVDRVQELHILIGHIICENIEKQIA